MIFPIALVAVTLLGAAGPDPGVPPAAAGPAAPAADAADAGARQRALHPGDFAFELCLGAALDADPGELEASLGAGVVAVPWDVGPLRLGLRAGAFFASARDACPEDDCGLGAFYVGPVLRLAPLARAAVSPWVDLSATVFLGGALDGTSLVGLELPRVDAGLDFVPLGGWRLGVFAFRARTPFRASPPPLADGAVVVWGGGVRFSTR